jgi:hypothetical protein
VGSRPSLSSIGEYGRDPRSRILWPQLGPPPRLSGLHVRAWLLHSAQSSDVGRPGRAKAIERAEKLRANVLLGRLLPSRRQSRTNPQEREGRLRFLVPAGARWISQEAGWAYHGQVNSPLTLHKLMDSNPERCLGEPESWRFINSNGE